MHFGVVSIFPTLIESVLQHGVTRRAVEADIIQVVCQNPREFAKDKHQCVDDRPYGGGPGMVMRADCLIESVEHLKQQPSLAQAPVLYLSPQGRPLTQADVERFAEWPSMVLICGRYEGIDERVIDAVVDEEVSLGDYVISGGELGAMVLIDAVTRLLPGALGDERSAQQDSFSDGLLDYPHYTRPAEYRGMAVPDVLQSGHHQAIEAWREQQAADRTKQRRPDLLDDDEQN